jgi:permuted papain-like amidase YaeF/Yiix C92 family enzyme
MTIRRFLVTTVLLLSSCGRTVDATVRDGDIIFQESRSDQSRAIQLATHSSYSHMGLILFQNGQPFVLEAIAHVQLTPLPEWTARGQGGRFVVKRLRDGSVLGDPRNVAALKTTALSFVGRPYDPYFEWSDERIYCSELVWKAFERSLRIRLGALAPLSSFDLSDPVVKAKLAQRFGDRVPLDEQVISPVSILNSPLLQGAP